MNRKVVERNIAVLLFVFVMVLFSLADKDSRKLKQLYTTVSQAAQKVAISTPSSSNKN
jgi:hypothetical protein